MDFGRGIGHSIGGGFHHIFGIHAWHVWYLHVGWFHVGWVAWVGASCAARLSFVKTVLRQQRTDF